MKIYLVDWFDGVTEWKAFLHRLDAIQSLRVTYSKMGAQYFEVDQTLDLTVFKLDGKPIARILELDVLERETHF